MTAERRRINEVRDVVIVKDRTGDTVVFHVREWGLNVSTPTDASDERDLINGPGIDVTWTDLRVLLEAVVDKAGWQSDTIVL